ncbi:hypothetical protein BH11MYX3_BH11MYX3_22230 [soil metagenome]
MTWSMRSLTSGLVLALAAACSGTSDPAKPSPVAGPHIRVTYDLDLERAVDDRLVTVRDDLLARGMIASITVSARSAVRALPVDPSRTAELKAQLAADYGDSITMRDCGGTSPAGSICIELSPDMVTTVKKGALASAVQIINARLVAVKLEGALATVNGERIVIELTKDDAKLATLRAMIPRSGRLEFKVVDDGSDFMQRVFAHVGNGDPVATQAGIRGEVDQWRPEDGSAAHTDYYLIAPERRSIDLYLGELARSDPSFKLPDDRQLGFERLEPNKPGDRVWWRSYYLERTPALTGKAISSATVSQDPNMGRAIVLLEFGRDGGRVFGELTARIVGKKLATLLDDQVKSAPIITGPIRGGRASITMGGTDPRIQQRDAEELALVLKTGALPTPLLEVAVDVVP